MMEFCRLKAICFRYGLVAAMLIASNVGCANSPPAGSISSPTRTVLPAETVTIQPTEDLIQPNTPQPSRPAAASVDITQEMIARVNRDRALADLRKLSGEDPICDNSGCTTINDRLTGGQGLQRAKNYVVAELKKLGYTIQLFDWSLSGYSDQNVIARKLGVVAPEEAVFFVAHLDGVKKDDAHSFPSADDNASGAVDILEVARVLSAYSFERTVVLFFSTGEEEGTLGVKSYISQLSSQEISAIKYVVNIDMVGYDGNNDRVMQLWHGDHAPSQALTQTISDIIAANQLNLVPMIVPGCG